MTRAGSDEINVSARGDWTRADVALAAVITLGGGILRLARLTTPNQLMFDETYYAKDACWYVNASSKLCDVDTEQTTVHPALGKWLIGMGVEVFGYDALGWRIASVVAGTLTIALLFMLAKRILHSTVGAVTSSGLLAIDPLHFVQSRVAMLDIFVCLFGVAAFLFLVYDRERLLTRLSGRNETRSSSNFLLRRPWRMAAGAAAGAATASKWSGALFVLAVLALSIAWEISARRADGKPSALRRALADEGLSITLSLVVLPAAVYAASFIGRVDGTLLAAPWSQGSWWVSFWQRHSYMLDFHRTLTSSHSYQSPPWSWPLLKRPVSYFFCSGSDCQPDVAAGAYDEVLATGSPFVWWVSLLALVYVAVRWIARRDLAGAEGVILGGFVFTYALWPLLAAGRGAVFLFYLLPSIPFMMLALGYVTTRIGASWAAKTAVGLFAAGAIGLFAFYYPLLAAVPIPRSDWEARIWVFDDCDKPAAVETTTTVTETTDDETTVRTSVTTTNESLPPTGWCWI